MAKNGLAKEDLGQGAELRVEMAGVQRRGPIMFGLSIWGNDGDREQDSTKIDNDCYPCP